ncbi:GyrI-like domain-containing protein [Rudanella lutea]|uniref:GyrI-like domain-containing protein n=1 Tax=Rudanella lutea TaxID=451374 RepID=UPI0005C4D083|nr:GyrI-like domain-containing protein [Rudanella lutea]
MQLHTIQPRIETATEKKLVGKRLTMSLANYTVGELWRGFRPRLPEINHRVSNDLISLVVYPPSHFVHFDPANEFERWAAVEVTHFDQVPNELETFVVPGGLYAVFDYKGSSTNSSIFQYILGVWLPNSAYILDNRPHFEVLGEAYRNNDPLSEEAIWVPIQVK